MTLEDALGYPPVTLEDFVMARVLFGVQKRYTEGDPDPEDTARDHIKQWDNGDLLCAISLALEDMKEFHP